MDGAKGQGEFSFPISEKEFHQLRQGLESANYRSLGKESQASRHGRPAAKTIQAWQPVDPHKIGQQLSKALFTGEVGERFRSAQEMASIQKDTRCGVILQLDPTVPELARLLALPWELLLDPEDSEFLLPDRRWPLLRSLDVRWSHAPLPPATDCLNLLILTAQPQGLARLAADDEIRKIQDACHPGDRIKIEILRAATPEALRPKLEDADLLHFIGHGSADPTTGEGSLALEDGQGGRRDLGAKELARICRDLHRLRLITLNACDTALVTGEDVGLNPFAGVATALIQQGIPAVIAMQWTLSDPAGIRFGEALYRSLATKGDLLEAVEAGRHAIHIAEKGSLEWATPVLYLHNQAEVLLIGERPSEAPPEPLPQEVITPPPRQKPRPSRWVAVVGGLLLVVAVIVGMQMTSPKSPAEQGDTTKHLLIDPGISSDKKPAIETTPPPPPPPAKKEIPLQALVSGKIGILVIDRNTGQPDRDVAMAIEAALVRSGDLNTFIPRLETGQAEYVERLASGDLSALPGKGRTPWGVEYLLVSTATRKALPAPATHIENIGLTLNSRLITANQKIVVKRVSEYQTGSGGSLDTALTQAADRCLMEIITTLNGENNDESET